MRLNFLSAYKGSLIHMTANRRDFLRICALLAAGVLVTGLTQAEQAGCLENGLDHTQTENTSAQRPTEQENLDGAYRLTKSKITGERDYFRREFGNEPDISYLRDYLESNLVNSIFPFWYGTAWDFNGTTDTPGNGSIACGYFVSTALHDLGYNLNRYSLARLPSGKIIKTFVDDKDIHRFTNTPLEKFCDAVQEEGEGIYIVGLDFHVGFLYQKEGETRFIHSSYVAPRCVVDEDARASQVLGSSAYRVIGKLFSDEMVHNWLEQERLN